MQIPCQYLLFDLDGTLVDSTRHISACWRAWANENQLDAETVDLISRGRTAKETISLLLPAKANINELSHEFALKEIKSAVGINAIYYAKQLLVSISSDRWGVVTSATKALAMARLKSAGLPSPKVLVTADSVLRGKPAPDSYILAAQLLGAQTKNCLVFEDSQNGIDAATAAGIAVIHVNGEESVDGVLYSIKNYERVRVKQRSNGLVVSIDN